MVEEKQTYDALANELKRFKLEATNDLILWLREDKNKLMKYFSDINMHPTDTQNVYNTLVKMVAMEDNIFLPANELMAFIQDKPMWVKRSFYFFWRGYEKHSDVRSFYDVFVDIVELLQEKQWRKTREYIILNSNNKSKEPVRFMHNLIMKRSARKGIVETTMSTRISHKHEDDEHLSELLIALSSYHHPRNEIIEEEQNTTPITNISEPQETLENNKYNHNVETETDMTTEILEMNNDTKYRIETETDMTTETLEMNNDTKYRIETETDMTTEISELHEKLENNLHINGSEYKTKEDDEYVYVSESHVMIPLKCPVGPTGPEGVVGIRM